MNRCNHPAHPHCTVWVMPGDAACAHGHVQPVEPAPAPAIDLPATVAGPIAADPLPRPHLRVSGFDPRAAGGRQVLRLELRGMPPGCAPEVTLQASSRLRLESGARHAFTRTARGEWLPVFLEFSSRGLEHGQYRIELVLHGGPEADSGAPARTWIATLLILAPRVDASLLDIHQAFLATHKNVRVSADDASIARVQARLGGGSVDIDVKASNAGIAHLDLDGGGKIDLGFSSIAWDEELFEVDQPLVQPSVQAPARPRIGQGSGLAPGTPHPCPASSACLVFDAAQALAFGLAHPVRHLRLFALDECVLGRYEPGEPEADLLLAHHLGAGPVADGLTRRISARHALLRRGRGREGFEIEDVSRYGLLVDGAWPGKHAPLPLRTGMRIELTASIPGVAVLEVVRLLPNGVLLQRVDAGKAYEAFCLLAPEHGPGSAGHDASALPLLFHREGGFWLRGAAGGEAAPLTPASATERLAGWPHVLQFAARPYPDMRADIRADMRADMRGADRRRASPARGLSPSA